MRVASENNVISWLPTIHSLADLGDMIIERQTNWQAAMMDYAGRRDPYFERRIHGTSGPFRIYQPEFLIRLLLWQRTRPHLRNLKLRALSPCLPVLSCHEMRQYCGLESRNLYLFLSLIFALTVRIGSPAQALGFQKSDLSNPLLGINAHRNRRSICK
jgi:hypothetical protein